MPADIDFDLPFPPMSPPKAAVINEVPTVQWLTRYGLLHNSAQVRHFTAIGAGAWAAYCYPDSVGADLNIVADVAAFITIVNDRIDSVSERRAEHGIEICNDLLALLQHERPTEPASPLGDAWCDLWQRTADGSSALWRDRFRCHFSQVFSGYLATDTTLTKTQYLARRRATFGTAVCLDLAERSGHFELSEPVRASSVITRLLEETSNLRVLTHDVRALEWEEARGKVDNIVLVMEHSTGRSRAQVIADIQEMVRDAGRAFLLLESRLPELSSALSLNPADRAALASFIKAARDLIRGEYDWHRQATARYDPLAGTGIASGYEAAD
jgi:pentalenene synthase/avermitilol synthase